MVNRIKSVDDNGNICQVFTNENDVTHFGMIQDIYKMQPPKENETVDNIKMAKSRLKRLQDESSIKAVGNIQCITGYTIEVQEDQLKGKFFIKSDTHNFSGNVHTMDLTLEYIPDNPQIPEIEQQDIAVPVFKSSKRKKALVAVMEVSKLIKDYLQVLMLGVELQWIMGEMGALKLLEKWEAITAHF